MRVIENITSLGSAQLHPLAVLGIGGLILVVIVLFHGVGLHHIVPRFNRRIDELRVGRPHRIHASFTFGWTIFLFLVLHLLEVGIWTFFVLLLGLVADGSAAFYFTATTYTTLGIEANILPVAWRNFCPIIAISGLFAFAWSGSSLVNVVRNYYDLVEALRVEMAEQRKMRREELKQEQNLLRETREQIRHLREEERQQAKGEPLQRRWELRKEERDKEKGLRRDAAARSKELFEEERRKEEDLGHKPPGQSG